MAEVVVTFFYKNNRSQYSVSLMQERPGAVRTIAFVWLGDLCSDDTPPNDVPTQVVTALGLAAFFASKQTVIVD